MGTNKNREQTFRFRQFSVANTNAAMKVGTDGVALGAWVDGNGCRRVLDAGTGTGLISLMIAQRYTSAMVTAIEIDPDAAEEARHNVALSPWADRIEVSVADFAELATTEPFDLIVSNPPFFVDALKSGDQRRTMARHATTLDYRSLIGRAPGLLRPDGRLAMVLPAEFEADVEFRATMARMTVSRLTRLITKAGSPPKRILIEITNNTLMTATAEQLLIGSPEYKAMTADFYL